MNALFEQLRRILCCKKEDGHHHRQTERNLGHGSPLIARISGVFGSSSTYHHQEQESSRSLTFTPPSLLPLHVHLLVHNPLTKDLIGLQNELKFGMTVDDPVTGGLSHSSHSTFASASVKPSNFAAEPFIVSSSDPFVSPAKPLPISDSSKLYLAPSPQPWSQPSLSRLQCPSLETCLPAPKVDQHSPQSAKQCKPVFSRAIIQTEPTLVSTDSNKYVPKSETSESLLPNTKKPSSLKFTPPPSSSSPCHVVVQNPMTRDTIRPKNEPNLGRTASGLTLYSHVTSPFNAVPLASPQPSASISKPLTATSSDPFVSPDKAAALTAHLSQRVSESSQPSNELSKFCLSRPSLLKTSSTTPQVQQHSSPIPEPYECVECPGVLDITIPPISAHSNQDVAKPPWRFDEPSSSHVQSPSSMKITSCAPKAQERSAKQYKPVLRAVFPVSPNQKEKTVYVQKDTSPIYNIPKDIQDLIKRDIVPEVLQKPLSPLTYRDYFSALLYAEDFYIEKWTDFILKDVTLELNQLTIYKNERDDHLSREKVPSTFVKFKMESIPERRPFLLSRDFVFAKPLDKRETQFQGFIYRVEKRSLVLAKFGDDFHSQHHSSRRYNISFSFNRVCLKRAHQAVEAATDPSFHSFLFPECTFRRDLLPSTALLFSSDVLYSEQKSAICRILSLKGSAPFLVEGPLWTHSLGLSRAGVLVREAVLQVYQHSEHARILVAAPINKVCDVLLRSLKNKIPDSEIFRANAAFREYDCVPDDILPFCLYKKKSECFICPSLQQLQRFKVIFSTFVNSFRLRNEGIEAGHFSHIFLVDASSASEPEAMIVLANLAKEDTTVVVTGMQGIRSSWVRSPIAKKNGLGISYFERLKQFTPYKNLNPAFIARLDPEPESDEINIWLS